MHLLDAIPPPFSADEGSTLPNPCASLEGLHSGVGVVKVLSGKRRFDTPIGRLHHAERSSTSTLVASENCVPLGSFVEDGGCHTISLHGARCWVGAVKQSLSRGVFFSDIHGDDVRGRTQPI
jgi:hypothetical protein